MGGLYIRKERKGLEMRGDERMNGYEERRGAWDKKGQQCKMEKTEQNRKKAFEVNDRQIGGWMEGLWIERQTDKQISTY
jgi:hypothetical protein